MLNSIRRFFSAPVFEDENENRSSFLLNFITLVYFVVTVLILAGAFAGSADNTRIIQDAMFQTLPLFFALTITQILLRTRRVQTASIVFGVLLWLSHTNTLYTSGGAQSLSMFNYILSIMVFGLLLGRRYAILCAAASTMAVIVAYNLEARGLLPASRVDASDPGLVGLFNFTFLTALSTSFLYLYLRLLDEAIQRLRSANLELSSAGRLTEQRITDRTRDLEIVAEVGAAAAAILESNRLLQTVADLTKERFNLYHSHIYLLDEEGKNLVLAAGAGEPGRIMAAEKRSIPLDREQSLVARAAREQKGVTVNDVTQAPDFLPNPLLPDTRSELAAPMIVGGKVIGVFDAQSDQVGRFTEADVNIQTTLAAQLATSVQNVRSFEHARAQAELETTVNTIGQKIQRAGTMEETLQTAVRELGLALGAPRVRARIERNDQPSAQGGTAR